MRLLLSLSLPLLAAPALAQPAVPVMRLDYTRSPGAEACPEEQVFRDAVGAQVRRWDPFAANGPWSLRVVVSRKGGGYAGSVELRDATGAVRLDRAYPPTPRCIDLLGDLARAVGFKVDPPSPPSASPPALVSQTMGETPKPPARPVTMGETPKPPARPVAMGETTRPSPPPPRGLMMRLGGGARMDLGTAPRPALGLSLDFGVRVAWFSIAAEGRLDPAAGSKVTGGEVDTMRVVGALVPCGHVGMFAGCLLAELGKIWGSSGGAARQTRFHGAAGGRLAAEIPVTPRLSARLALDLTVMKPAFFQLAGQHRWETGSVAGGLGAGLVASF